MATAALGVRPFCGEAPSPDDIWSRWRFAPAVVIVLAALLATYFVGARRAGIAGRRQALFVLGWLIASLAFVSPLCPLSVSLFSARISQHMILTLVAAPIIVAGRPFQAYRALAPRLGLRITRPSPLLAAACFVLALWLWHAPGPYAATFTSTAVYWTMHLTLFGSALWLWDALFEGLDHQIPQTIAAGLLSSVQMTFLGALITLTPQAFYWPHFSTTAAWGLSPLEDQQLGGVIMWVPGCGAFLALALVGIGIAMHRADRALPAGAAAS